MFYASVKPAFWNSSGLKSFSEKLRFGDKLVELVLA